MLFIIIILIAAILNNILMYYKYFYTDFNKYSQYGINLKEHLIAENLVVIHNIKNKQIVQDIVNIQKKFPKSIVIINKPSTQDILRLKLLNDT